MAKEQKKSKRFGFGRRSEEAAAVDSAPSSHETASPPASVIPPKSGAPRRVMFEGGPEDQQVPDAEDVPRETERQTVAAVLPRPARPICFVVANQKGGVGKTTTTVNLAAALAAGGLRVLVVDMDPQGNASTALGVDHDVDTAGTYEVLLDGQAIEDVMLRSPEAGELWVVPATIDLAAAELELVTQGGREGRLKHAVEQLLDARDIDVIFFDCPPSLGLLTLNALVAADEILVPIQCEYYALEGVTQLVRTIDRVKGALNDRLVLGGVLLTMYDGRTKLSREVAEEVRRAFGAVVFESTIPRSVRVSEAPSYASSVLSYDPQSAGAHAYRLTAEELAQRIAKR